MDRRVILFWLLLFCSCQGKKENVIPEIRVDIDHPEFCRMDKLFYDPEVIFLQSGTDGFLGSVSRVAFWDNKLYVLDKKLSLVGIFGRDGRFLTSIRPTGKGPGEFDKLMDFFVDEKNNELVVYADRPYKFLYYDPEGRFKNELLAERLYHEVAPGEEGRIIALNVSENSSGYLSFLRHNERKITEEIFSGLPYQGMGGFYTTGTEMNRSENLNFTRRGDNIIYSLKDTEVIPRYRVDFGSHNLPEHLTGLREYDSDAQREIIGNRYIFSIVNIKETPGFLFFNTILPSTFILKKEEADLSCCRMMDWTYNVYHNQMVPCWDKENRLIVFSQPASELKEALDEEKAKELPAVYLEKLQRINDETDNPVLFVYRTRED